MRQEIRIAFSNLCDLALAWLGKLLLTTLAGLRAAANALRPTRRRDHDEARRSSDGTATAAAQSH
jgi:hypothetical protein